MSTTRKSNALRRKWKNNAGGVIFRTDTDKVAITAEQLRNCINLAVMNMMTKSNAANSNWQMLKKSDAERRKMVLWN